MMARWLALLLCLVGWAGVASAHTRSQSHSAWTVDGAYVHLAFSVADAEVARIAPVKPDDARLLAYLTPRLGAMAGDQACKLVAPPRMVVTVQLEVAERLAAAPGASARGQAGVWMQRALGGGASMPPSAPGLDLGGA